MAWAPLRHLPLVRFNSEEPVGLLRGSDLLWPSGAQLNAFPYLRDPGSGEGADRWPHSRRNMDGAGGNWEVYSMSPDATTTRIGPLMARE